MLYGKSPPTQTTAMVVESALVCAKSSPDTEADRCAWQSTLESKKVDMIL